MSAPILPPDRPPRVGQFIADRRISRNHRHEIWHGTDPRTGLDVALKLFVEATAPRELRARAAMAHARAHARAAHPCVLPVIDVDTCTGKAPPWIAFAWATGGALGDWWEGLEHWDWKTLRSVLVDVLDGLAHLHAMGVAHLDLTPGNVLVLDGGRCVLADLRTDVSRRREFTPAYAAPEQLGHTGATAGPWTDQHALGLISWELTFGAATYRDEDGRVRARRSQEGVPPLHPAFSVPVGYVSWVARLLAADPEARFRDVAEARAALPGSSKIVRRTPHRRPEAAALAVLIPPPTLTGREPAISCLRRAFRSVSRSGQPMGLCIVGPPGSGATALFRRFIARTQALVMELGPTDPMETALTVLGGRRPSIGRVAARLGLPVTDPLMRAIDDIRRSRDSTVSNRALLSRVLAVASADRPVVLWLPDLDRNSTSMELATWLVDQAPERPFPLLVVASTANVPTPIGWRRALLRPLDSEQMGAVLDAMLPLEPATRHALVEEGRGLPGAMIGRLRRYAESRALELRGGQWRLAQPLATRLPDIEIAAWLATLAPPVRLGVYVAAVLGETVDVAAWQAASAHAEGAEEVLLRAHWLRPAPEGWRWTHSNARPGLLAAARAEGVYESINATCASLAHDPERAADWFIEAGRPEEALEPLLCAARRCLRCSDARGATRHIERYEQALDVLGATGRDPRRAPALLLSMRARFPTMSPAGAHLDVALRNAITVAWEHRWMPELVGLLRQRGLVAARGKGERWLAHALTLQAETLARTHGLRDEELRAIAQRAEVARNLGDHESAMSLARGLLSGSDADRTRLTGPEATWLRGEALATLAACALSRGEPEARDLFRAALAAFDEVGHNHGTARCLNALGQFARDAGDRAEAEACFSGAAERFLLVESQDAAVPLLNVAVLRVAAGRLADAQSLVARARKLAQRDALRAMVEVVSFACAGADRTAAESSLAWLEARPHTLGADPDLATLLENGGRGSSWMRRACSLSARIHDATGDHEAANRCRAYAEVP